MAYRYLVAGLGLALMGLGGALLIQQPSPWRIALWLAVAVLTGAFGLRLRGVPRAALIVAGSLTAIALPPLLRPGGAANPTVVPLDYVRNWLLTMAAIAVAAGLWAGTRAALRGARRKP
ncbi:hypothetical protein VR46_36245 [Streptomyces sp. NRRL S-444]|nr:hypothetical protein VR46_36245 [Streptomyces sp. NRRL S-444]